MPLLDAMPPVEIASKTILDSLRAHSGIQGHVTAYTFLESDDECHSVTYKQLDKRAREIAHGLLKQAEPGDRALMMYPTGLEFIEAFLGCLYAGLVAVPAYPPKQNRNADRILAIAQDCTPRLLLCASQSRRNIEGKFAESVAGSLVFATDEMDSSGISELPELRSDQLAFLQYTSGSTADPKGVMVTHGNIVANEQLIQGAFCHDTSSVVVGWLPIFHDMGLIGNVLQPLFVGCHSILMSPNAFLRNPFAWLKAVSEYKATTTGAPNFAYELCVKKITQEQKRELDLSSLRIAYNGAEPVRAQTLDRFSQAFADCGLQKEACFPCYGMAETTLLVAGGPPLTNRNVVTIDSSAFEQHRVIENNAGKQIVSCGQVGSGLEVRIVNPESHDSCQPNEVGEIWLHGASVAEGYWNRPEETKEAFRSRLEHDVRDWFRTGDFGFLRDGELYVTGRLKDLIIIRGRNIYPQDVEQLVEQHLDFVEPNSCAAFSVEDQGEEKLVVVIEGTREMVRWSKGNNSEHQQCKQNLDEQIEGLREKVFDKFEVALSRIEFVRPTTFPRTSSGKVQRRLAKRLLRDEKFDVIHQAHAISLSSHRTDCFKQNSSTYATVRKVVEKWLRSETESEIIKIRDDEQFWTMGVDSVSAISLIVDLENTFDCKLSDGFLHRHHCINSIVQYFEGQVCSVDDLTVELVKDEADLEKVYRFRYEIYVEEMNRRQHYADHQRRRIVDPLDKHGDVFAMWDGDEVVGTVRVNLLRHDSLDEYRQLYGILGLTPEELNVSSISTRLMLAPHLRKTKASLLLAAAALEHFAQNKVRFDYCDCNDPVRGFFEQIGYRAVHRSHHPEYGDVSVMRLDLEDTIYLETINSPLNGERQRNI